MLNWDYLQPKRSDAGKSGELTVHPYRAAASDTSEMYPVGLSVGFLAKSLKRPSIKMTVFYFLQRHELSYMLYIICNS